MIKLVLSLTLLTTLSNYSLLLGFRKFAPDFNPIVINFKRRLQLSCLMRWKICSGLLVFDYQAFPVDTSFIRLRDRFRLPIIQTAQNSLKKLSVLILIAPYSPRGGGSQILSRIMLEFIDAMFIKAGYNVFTGPQYSTTTSVKSCRGTSHRPFTVNTGLD